MAIRKFTEFLFPTGNLNDAANAFGKIDGSEAEEIRRHCVRGFHDAEPQIRRIDLQFLSDLVELDFLAEARLRGAMSALGSARRLVGEGAAALITIARNMIGRGLQRARVKTACDSVTTIGATVDQRLQMHSRNRAVFFDAGLEFHQDRMAATVTIKNFFARQTDLDGPVEHQRSFGDNDFMMERIALSAETTAVRRSDHPNMGRGHF